MPPRIDHLGIAVRDIAASLPLYRDLLGLGEPHLETVEGEGVRVAMLQAGEARIELLEPTGQDGALARFLERRGPGLHHVCLRVDDLDAVLARLAEAGVPLAGEPREGAGGCRVAFVHPKGADGVLLELSEAPRG